MKKVLVEAYLSNNLGDDLFVEILTERYKNVEFTFNGGENSRIIEKKVNTKEGKFDFTKISKYDAFVVIGGSLFQETGGIIKWIKIWLKLFLKVIFFRLHRKKVVFIGFNFGPYKHKIFRILYGFLFRFVNYLSVRDIESYNLFQNNNNMHVYPDIVFSSYENNYSENDQRNSLGISIMDFGNKVNFQDDYEKLIINLIDNIDSDLTINAYAFQSSDNINDYLIIKKIEKHIHKKVIVHKYDGSNLKDFLEDFRNNKYMITSRFHSLVLAMLYNQKFFSISYNIKIDNLLRAVGLDKFKLVPNDFKNEKKISWFIKNINKSLNDEHENYSEKLTKEFGEKSKKHFEYLDRILGK